MPEIFGHGFLPFPHAREGFQAGLKIFLSFGGKWHLSRAIDKISLHPPNLSVLSRLR
jgi:hypothetical protein